MMFMGLLVVGGSYLLASIPFGFLLGKLMGIDVRRSGSGNIGATNVLRAAGPVQGGLTLLLDVGKGVAGPAAALALDLTPGWLSAAAAAAVFGHCFSIFLRFSGGKGVATFLGAFATLDIISAMVGGLAFLLGLATVRIVAVSSMLLTLGTCGSLAYRFGWDDPRFLGGLLCLVLIAIRHRDNWSRIRAGREGAFLG